jgi:hypothetical protein
MARRGGVRRIVLGGGAVFCALWLLSFGGVAHANCATMPDDPMCTQSTPPPTSSHTSPPATQPPQNTHTSTVTNSNSNTPAVDNTPRVVVRTPPRESFTPRRTPTFQPSVPAAPTENFQPATVANDPIPLPEVSLGAVDVAAASPQPQPAPPPPPPPAPTDQGPGPLPLALGGLGGIGAGAALARKNDEIDQNLKVAGAELGGGLALLTAVGVGIETGALAIGTTALAGPLLMGGAFALLALGAINLMTAFPKAPPIGAAAHGGSVRG